MQLEIPSKLEHYSVTQAASLIDYLATNPFDKPTIYTMCELISVVSGKSVDDIKKIDIENVKSTFKLILETVKRKNSNPPKRIKIEGNWYQFNQDLAAKEWTAGRFIDADVIGQDIAEYPARLLAILYIKEGTKYGEENMQDRADLFLKNFRGDHYMDVIHFFLQKREKLYPGFMVLQIARSKLSMKEAIKEIKNAG